RQSFIAGRRLNVSTAEWRFVEELSVSHAVQGAASGHGQILRGNVLVQSVQKMKKELFEAVLQRKCQIHVALRDFRVRATRFSEQLLHLVGEVTSQTDRSVRQYLHSLVAAERLEIAEIELESAIVRRDDFTDLVETGRLAEGRKAHDLTFVTVLRVADEL